MLNLIKFIVPQRLIKFIRLLALKGTNVHCPICNWNGLTFLPFGLSGQLRPNAQCPKCNSLERHRLIFLFLKKNNLLKANTKLLHVAPEPSLYYQLFKTVEYHPIDKFEGDYKYPSGTINMDITAIKFADNTFDAILCNHVLEHVLEDRKAIAEFYRVLKPGGWGIIQVPYDPYLESTYEDPSIVSPQGRMEKYGQFDHVRLYGCDYFDRLREIGFIIDKINYEEEFTEYDKFKYGLKNFEVHFVRKPSNS